MRTLFLVVLTAALAAAQKPVPAAAEDRHDHQADAVIKAVDDLMWHTKLGDIAQVDKVAFTSLPPKYEPNPTGQGAGNPMIIYAYTFVPKKLNKSARHPLLVYVHGGVHSDFRSGGASATAHIIRELVEQGYVIVAPEYRGSTGYGSGYYKAIDYGGRENDDTYAARAWMLENYDFLDPKRVGILGWSHGGMITLLNIFDHPKDFAVAYAGVPVSDLVARMGYKSESYREIYSGKSHIGKTAADNVAEYLKRSPVTHVAKLATPLLVHSTTNDEDVNVLEVRHLIAALKAEGKQFEYKIYDNAPGGHHFNRIDTKLARESRAEVWRFLAKYLAPGN